MSVAAKQFVSFSSYNSLHIGSAVLEMVQIEEFIIFSLSLTPALDINLLAKVYVLLVE